VSSRISIALVFASSLLAGAAGQTPATVPVPRTAEVEGIPPIPQSLAEAIAPYASFRQAILSNWHPTERRMLVNTRLGDTFQAYAIATPQADPVQMTFQPRSVGTWTPGPGAGAAWFADAGRAVLFRQDDGGNGMFQLYLLRPGAEPMLLTDGKSRNGVPVWSTKGDRIAYTSTRRDVRSRDVWVMNPLDKSSDRLLVNVSGTWEVVDWSADDRFLIAMETITRAETRLWQIEVSSGDKKQLTPAGAVAYDGGFYSADGKSLFITTDGEGEFRRLARLDLATGAITTLTKRINWDIEALAPSSNGRWVAFIANEAGVGRLYLLETRSGRIAPIKGIPSGSVQGLEWRRGSDELGFNLTSPKTPWNAFSVNVRTGVVERWTRADTGAVDVSRLADAELISWKSFDGRQISGFMYRPPPSFTGRRPVLINVHGGPEAQERPRFLGRSNYLLNDMGMVIIYPNIRGSMGFGKSFLALDNGVLRENAVKDLGALLDWIAAHKQLDASRVTIAGPSYGGLMALSVAAMYPDRVRCVFDGFGISNVATFLERAQPSIRPVRRGEYGDESDPEMRVFMSRTAPANHASKMRAPLFIVHGKNDPAVPVQESEQMVAAAKKAGVPVWVMYATNAGHGFADNRQNDEYSFYAWVLFMQAYLR
jgi:dipeptidyl aminopeptidase/acylaminoacyl peptidase